MVILGFNKPRPTAENYERFEGNLVQRLRALAIEGLSLMIYGSYIRGDYNPGRSDIDAVMVFSGNVVIDKEHLSQVSRVLEDTLREDYIPFQVTVTDLRTMQDGRFNSYDPSFKQYFYDEGKIVVGSDCRSQFQFELPTMDGQTPVRFNLRKTRLGLLFAEHDIHQDYEEFLRRFNRTLDAVSRGSKQILHFMDGTLRTNRFSALEALRVQMPEIDTEPLERIRRFYTHTSELDALYKSPKLALSLFTSAVSLYESMIQGYLDRTPHP